MRVSYNEFLAGVYASLFDFPLSRLEMRKWAIGNQRLPKKEFLIDEKLVRLRKEREKISRIKLLKLLRILKLLKQIDTIEAVFVTGSVAVLNATWESDIDLMLICKPGTVWRTRLMVLKLLKKLKLGRTGRQIKDRICTNIFLDLEHLEIYERNLYTAHEVLQAKCVFDRGGVEQRWLVANQWTKEFLPNVKVVKIGKRQSSGKGEKSIVEVLAFLMQLVYMWPKMTREKVGLGFAFFHPVDGSKVVLTKFELRLRELQETGIIME